MHSFSLVSKFQPNRHIFNTLDVMKNKYCYLVLFIGALMKRKVFFSLCSSAFVSPCCSKYFVHNYKKCYYNQCETIGNKAIRRIISLSLNILIVKQL